MSTSVHQRSHDRYSLGGVSVPDVHVWPRALCLATFGCGIASSDILVLKLISVVVFILFSSQNFYFI